MRSISSRVTAFVLAGLSATGPIGVDMYLPGLPDMARDLGVDEGAMQLSLMVYFLGLMLGQLVYGPLSDKYGRKPLIYLGLAVFILGCVGCASSEHFEQHLWWRFLQGLGGSIGLVIAFAIVRDAFRAAHMGKMISIIMAVLGLSPVIAPMIGSALLTTFSWHGIFWALAGYGVMVATAVALALEETRNVQLRATSALKHVLRNYTKIFVDNRFLPFALALCTGQAGFFAYIAGSASVLISEYGLTPVQFSLLFGLNALGLVFAALINPWIHHRFGALRSFRLLNTAYFMVLTLLAGYLICGHKDLVVLSAGLFITIALLGSIMPTGSQLALIQQGEHAGTASALMGSLQFGAGALVTVASGALAYLGAVGLILVMLVCATTAALLCIICLPRRIDL
ncbi:multidrug effflux MFS transporter [Pseudomonas putida]|uniref:multidrug effflux MFS transporter n=1 Tax=Pseudomonas putida TaxID=303 RepID=UPI002363784C|nr:multidrug effflux MFS transporter [Pseudomonas putida]MDD2050943.1 multidrug effflux MFS transporter [Pseudomonas putida]